MRLLAITIVKLLLTLIKPLNVLVVIKNLILVSIFKTKVLSDLFSIYLFQFMSTDNNLL